MRFKKENEATKSSNAYTGARMLDATDLVGLGFSRAIAYQLLNRADFPTVRIGRRLYVRYDRLIEWLDTHENGGKENG